MTHSSRTIWIMLLGILTMLMSNYVSSAPSMVMKSMLASELMLDKAHSVDFVMSSEHDYGHSSNLDKEYLTSPLASHCDDPETDAHMTCGSVCSSASVPVASIRTNSEFSSRFAHFTALTMGEKVSRSQSILRPPSA